jgi:hypothetical protein
LLMSRSSGVRPSDDASVGVPGCCPEAGSPSTGVAVADLERIERGAVWGNMNAYGGKWM